MTDLPYWTLHEAPPDSPKKWAVRVPTASGRGKVVLFGARGYEDFTTHHDVERRERYRTRHQHDRIDDPYAPGFWSMWALWGESDDLDTAFAAAVRKAKLLARRRNPEEALETDMVLVPRRNPVRAHVNFMRNNPDLDPELAAKVEQAQRIYDEAATIYGVGLRGDLKNAHLFDLLLESEIATTVKEAVLLDKLVKKQSSTPFKRLVVRYEDPMLKDPDELQSELRLYKSEISRMKKMFPSSQGYQRERLQDLIEESEYDVGVLKQMIAALTGPRQNPRPLREDWLEMARAAGRNDAINFGSAIAERHDYLAQAGWRSLDEDDRMALLQAWEQGVGDVRQNPEWARKVGGVLYRGTRKAAKYAKEVSTDLYHGAREAHRSHRDKP